MNLRILRSIRMLVLAAAFALAALLAAAPVPAQAAAKLSAPDLFQPDSELGYVGLAWNLDYDDTGDNPISPDEELIDHFNVYCDGRLVVQVDISAVYEDVSYYDGSRFRYWFFSYDPGDRWVMHNFQVSSVAKDGTEGYLSEARSAEARSGVLEVVSHQASVGTTDIGLEFKVLGYYNLARFDLWRSEGTTPPDTSAEPYAVITTNRRPEATSWDYWDQGIAANTTYTYTVRATDREGTESNFYTFTVICKDDAPSLNPPYVDFEVVNNTTPTLTFSANNWADSGYPTVYKFYRNNVQVGSFTGEGEHSFSDTPTTDGTYTYRVDLVVAGFTVRGREYTFSRNTTPVNPNTFPKKPDAPSLVGRLDSEHYVTLAWTPAETGGEVEGYHIYRKDAGAFVEGSYRSGNYYFLRGLNRYLDVSADTTAFADIGIPGATDAYLGNYDLGQLTEVLWGESNTPHEYYVTAYNDYGESAPSNVVVFPYAGGVAPASGDTAAPGAPTITRAWVEWEDDSNSDYYVNQGIFDENLGYNIRVAWDEPEGAAETVGSYRATFDDGGGYVHEDRVPRYGLLNGLHVQDGLSEYSPLHHVYAGSASDFNKQFTVIMYAQNEAGETASVPVTVQVYGPPRIQVIYDNGNAVVRWADPVFSTATVTGWELYRRPEHGLVSKVGEFGPDVHEYVDADVLDGWTYEYYVVAKTSEGDRQSVTASRLISKGDGYGEDVGAPTNLTATVINGRLVLSWERPANENIYVSFYIVEFKYPGSDEWVTRGDYAYGGYEGMTIDDVADFVDKDMQVRVYAESYDGTGEHERSEPASFRITSAQAASHVDGAPDTVFISGEAGEGCCRITWSTSTDTGRPPATEYRIKRLDTAYGIYGNYVTIGIVAAKGDGIYDYEYVDRYAENGRTYRYMVYPANSGTEALVDSNYDYVELSPSAKTHDQQVAEAVAELIASLPAPENVTVDDVELIREVAAIWGGLTDAQQKLVKETDKTLPSKLADDVAAADDLELLERYAELVAPVQALIDALPDAGDVTAADEGQIAEARAAYEALSPTEAKRLVRTARLVAAEEALATLAYREAAAAVDALIDALPDADEVTEADQAAIEAAREAYEALTDGAKALVEGLSKLEAAERALAALRPIPMYRLYNRWSYEHFYTGDEAERDKLVSVGWTYEGIGWYAPAAGDPVYRLYNRWAPGGDHHYTMDRAEYDHLVSVGWTGEGVGWCSDPNHTVTVYREYNPYEFAHNHNYTANRSEHDMLVGVGWHDEGIGWYGV